MNRVFDNYQNKPTYLGKNYNMYLFQVSEGMKLLMKLKMLLMLSRQ